MVIIMPLKSSAVPSILRAQFRPHLPPPRGAFQLPPDLP